MKTSPKHLIEADGSHSENCYPCRLKSISIAPSAMPTRSPVAASAKERDPLLDKDRAAYRRLRRDGTQPKAMTGAAKLEKEATEKFEVDTGFIVKDPSDRRQYAQAFAEMPKPNPHPKGYKPKKSLIGTVPKVEKIKAL